MVRQGEPLSLVPAKLSVRVSRATAGSLKLIFHMAILSDFLTRTGLLPYRELNDTLGLTDTGANILADARTGKNGRHRRVTRFSGCEY
jgi:hypothetical protein